MHKKETAVVVLLLLALGLSIFTYRVGVLKFPLLPNQSVASWHVEIKVILNGDGGPLGVEGFLPQRTNTHTIVDENYVSDGFGTTTREDKNLNNRIVSWTKRSPKKQEILYYRGILYESYSANSEKITNVKNVKNINKRPQYGSMEFESLQSEREDYVALGNLIEELRSKSIDDKSFALDLFTYLEKNAEDDRIVQILESNSSISDLNALKVYILEHVGIKAHLINGIELTSLGRNVTIETAAEVNLDGSWKQYDPASGVFFSNTNFLKLWVGDEPFVKIDGNYQERVTIAVKRHTENALTEAMWSGDPVLETLYKLSVFNLPVDVQLVFSILLLVPLGAVVVCFMRQIVGVQTFGTFMPILVALAFRETQLAMGIVLFTVIVSMGLIFRSYLNRLQLLIVPRLSAIMTMVVVALYLLSVLAYNIDLYTGLSISLFPLVILTMLIERISVSWDEFGARLTIISIVGSLFVAIVSYYVMNNSVIGHLMVTFPELLLVMVAITIMIGRYNGYKLTEYYRFRMFAEDDQSKSGRS